MSTLSKRVMVSFMLAAVLLLTGAVALAQSEVVFVIGWEQEPDRQTLVSNSAFSSYLDNFFHRDTWDWRGTELEIFPVMVEQIPSFDNGLVTTVPVHGDFNGDGTEEDAEAPVVTYKLRSGMLWSDGTPITADDCMFYHHLMMQENPVDSVQRGFYPDVVEKAEKVDDLTVTLTYNAPWPDFLSNALLLCGFPAHKLLSTVDPDGDGVFTGNLDDAPYFQDWTQAVGYGPYVVSEYNAGQNMIFTRNSNWGINDFEIVPAIDTVITQYILESAQMQNALQVGDIDMAFNFTTPEGYDSMGDVTVFSTPGVFNDALWVNLGEKAHPALQDVRVRKAIAHAIDRRALADQYIGAGTGADLPLTWFPRQFWSPDLGFLEYDVDLANQLLDEAGWVDSDGDGLRDKDGVAIILRFFTTPRAPRPDYQLVIQTYLQAVGIGTQIFVVEGPTVLFASFGARGILNSGEYDLAIYGRSNSPLAPGTGSPNSFHCSGVPSIEAPSGQNSAFYCNPEFDEIDTKISLTIDPNERLQLQYQLEKLFVDDAAYWYGLYFRQNYYAVRSDRWDIESMKQMGVLQSNYFNMVEFWQPLK